MAAGFGGTDSYNVYDKALFVDRTAAGRLHRYDDEEGEIDGGVKTDKFKPDKGFKGAEVSAGPRSKPVEFERPPEEADPFGLDQFLSEKKGALDGIGASGGMKASGGGASGYDELSGGGSGRKMQFQSSGRQ
eukprot:gene5032-34819_t